MWIEHPEFISQDIASVFVSARQPLQPVLELLFVAAEYTHIHTQRANKLQILCRQLLAENSVKKWLCAAFSVLHGFERYCGKPVINHKYCWVESDFLKNNPHIKLVCCISYISVIYSYITVVSYPFISHENHEICAVFHWRHPWQKKAFLMVKTHEHVWSQSPEIGTQIVSDQTNCVMISPLSTLWLFVT